MVSGLWTQSRCHIPEPTGTAAPVVTRPPIRKHPSSPPSALESSVRLHTTPLFVFFFPSTLPVLRSHPIPPDKTQSFFFFKFLTRFPFYLYFSRRSPLFPCSAICRFDFHILSLFSVQFFLVNGRKRKKVGVGREEGKLNWKFFSKESCHGIYVPAKQLVHIRFLDK